MDMIDKRSKVIAKIWIIPCKKEYDYVVARYIFSATYLTAACYDTDRSACRDWTFHSTGQALVLYGKTMGIGGRVRHLYCTIRVTRWKKAIYKWKNNRNLKLWVFLIKNE